MSGVFKHGDRVYVDDPGLAQLRQIMRDATGVDAPPNHHGTVEDVWRDSDTVLIHFDDGVGAPYPAENVHHLTEDTDGG
jgi:hypothetical protein